MKDITGSFEAGREFYSVSDVAMKFGISRKSVYRLIERRLLSSSNALRKKMISRASIDAFIIASQQGGAR
jgi:predicted DNA-binding transcriptional regulator AlpA